ncbi:MAG: hypothetical protein IT336_08685 [Thermomicrobiales bacterium]|nr:hypothetical protein [Thermomicrobiales bacterium]
MATTITIHERTVDGRPLLERTIELLTERVSARELIRSYVYQEVTEHNARLAQSRVAIGATRLAIQTTRVEWEPQFQKAVNAFMSRALVVVVDGKQVETLDEEITVKLDSSVTFLRLIPLVGG